MMLYITYFIKKMITLVVLVLIHVEYVLNTIMDFVTYSVQPKIFSS